MAYYGNNVNPNWYYNPTNPIAQPQMPYQSYAPQQPSPYGIQWVDGEVGAKAYQMPAGIAPGTPVALWDTNDQVIYLKSMNQMGMPNPIQKIHYTMDDNQLKQLPAQNSMSGAAEQNSKYVTKEDLESFRDEIKEMLKTGQTVNKQRGGST